MSGKITVPTQGEHELANLIKAKREELTLQLWDEATRYKGPSAFSKWLDEAPTLRISTIKMKG